MLLSRSVAVVVVAVVVVAGWLLLLLVGCVNKRAKQIECQNTKGR